MKKQKEVIVVEYNSDWAEQFRKLKQVFEKQLKDLIITVEHIGSTSIEGLAAKPIIDLDIIIENDEHILQQVITKLEKLGYKHRGDLGIVGREAFKRSSSKVPYDESNSDWMKHHLYVCKKDSLSLLNHLIFRDYLRENANSKNEYGKLKKKLAEKFPYDIDSYIDGKTEFILSILSKFNFEKSDLSNIEKQNKLKN